MPMSEEIPEKKRDKKLLMVGVGCCCDLSLKQHINALNFFF